VGWQRLQVRGTLLGAASPQCNVSPFSQQQLLGDWLLVVPTWTRVVGGRRIVCRRWLGQRWEGRAWRDGPVVACVQAVPQLPGVPGEVVAAGCPGRVTRGRTQDKEGEGVRASMSGAAMLVTELVELMHRHSVGMGFS
jgi:hypothetical protein